LDFRLTSNISVTETAQFAICHIVRVLSLQDNLEEKATAAPN